jgi:hypothetical protein
LIGFIDECRRPAHSRPSLRREIRYELIQDPDGSWVWRHHPGHLPVLPKPRSRDDRLDCETLWDAPSRCQVGTSVPSGRIGIAHSVLGMSHLRRPRLLANKVFAVPMTGLHVRRMFDERCRVR